MLLSQPTSPHPSTQLGRNRLETTAQKDRFDRLVFHSGPLLRPVTRGQDIIHQCLHKASRQSECELLACPAQVGFRFQSFVGLGYHQLRSPLPHSCRETPVGYSTTKAFSQCHVLASVPASSLPLRFERVHCVQAEPNRAKAHARRSQRPHPAAIELFCAILISYENSLAHPAIPSFRGHSEF